MMTGFGLCFGGIGSVFMILFWVAVIAGIVWLVWSIDGTNTQLSMQTQSSANTPEILDRRYANSELTYEQHEAIKQDLQ